MHSTDNLEDGYIGSGKLLRRSINKHGKENHVCETLEFLESRELLKQRERELINVELLNDSMCMNLALGGEGGWLNQKHKEVNLAAFQLASHNKLKELRMNPEWAENRNTALSRGVKKAVKDGKLIPPDWTGKSHRNETILKMKESKKGHGVGSTNSQFGKRWITNGIENQRIYKDDPIPEGWRLGRKI
jgi:hypothetical protein